MQFVVKQAAFFHAVNENVHFVHRSLPGVCAARIGYVNKYILHKDLEIGVIAALRNVHIHSLPHIGDTIRTQVDIVEDVFGMTLAKAVITLGEDIIVTAEIKIALREE